MHEFQITSHVQNIEGEYELPPAYSHGHITLTTLDLDE